MDTIIVEKIKVDELTTLDVALKAYHREKFLAIKQELLGSEFDKEAQAKIWEDYHDLMSKAVFSDFDNGDFKRLESYRQLEGCFELVSDETRLFFPTEITRDESGQFLGVTLTFLDQEVTKKWFEYIYDILIGQKQLHQCAAADCSNLFLLEPKSKRFCSEACRNREWQKKYRIKKS